jgi:hypothetical protein
MAPHVVSPFSTISTLIFSLCRYKKKVDPFMYYIRLLGEISLTVLQRNKNCSRKASHI